MHKINRIWARLSYWDRVEKEKVRGKEAQQCNGIYVLYKNRWPKKKKDIEVRQCFIDYLEIGLIILLPISLPLTISLPHWFWAWPRDSLWQNWHKQRFGKCLFIKALSLATLQISVAATMLKSKASLLDDNRRMAQSSQLP